MLIYFVTSLNALTALTPGSNKQGKSCRIEQQTQVNHPD
jgi:hypothetical protein